MSFPTARPAPGGDTVVPPSGQTPTPNSTIPVATAQAPIRYTSTSAVGPGHTSAATPAGTAVRVWLDRSGNPQAPPPSTDAMFSPRCLPASPFTAGATVALILCYLFCRATLDRQRLARWESA